MRENQLKIIHKRRIMKRQEQRESLEKGETQAKILVKSQEIRKIFNAFKKTSLRYD